MADRSSPPSSGGARRGFARQHSAPLDTYARYLQPRGRLDSVTFRSECFSPGAEEPLENVYSSEPPNIKEVRQVKSAMSYRQHMNSLRVKPQEPLSPSKLRVLKLKADGQWQMKLSGLRSKEHMGELMEPHSSGTLTPLIEPHPHGPLTPPEVEALETPCEELEGVGAPEADTALGVGGGAAGGLLSAALRDPMRALLGYAPLPREDPEIDPAVREERPTRESRLRRQFSNVKLEVVVLRRMALKMLQSITFQCLTVSCIIANAVVIGLETDMPGLPCWSRIELSFLWIFTLEVALRLFVHGPHGFFCGEGCCGGGNAQQLQAQPVVSPGWRRRAPNSESASDVVWNIFDFTIVSFGCTDQAILVFAGNNRPRGSGATLLRVVRLLRLLRLLRVVRVVRFLKQLYLLAYGFLEGALAVFWVGLLAATFIYLCAIVLVRAFHAKSPDEQGYEFFEEHFANVPAAMFTLFEIMASPTLGSYREVLSHSPLLAIFIVVFVVFGSFGMNGLLTGVISESIMEKNQARLESMRQEREAKRRLLESCCGELFDEVVGDPEGSMSIEAFRMHQDDIASLLMAAGARFPTEDLENMFRVMDYSDSGTIDKSDFLRGVLELCEDVRAMSIMEIHSQMSRCQLKIERYNLHLEQLVSLAEHHAMVVTQSQPLGLSARGVGAHESATCSTAPPTFSAERSCEGGGASPRPADAESGTESVAESGAAPAGGGAGAADLAALATVQQRVAAAARAGDAGAAGELAQLGRQLARLVQDNADLVGQCLVAQSERSAPSRPGPPAAGLPSGEAAANDAGGPSSSRF